MTAILGRSGAGWPCGMSSDGMTSALIQIISCYLL